MAEYRHPSVAEMREPAAARSFPAIGHWVFSTVDRQTHPLPRALRDTHSNRCALRLSRPQAQDRSNPRSLRRNLSTGARKEEGPPGGEKGLQKGPSPRRSARRPHLVSRMQNPALGPRTLPRRRPRHERVPSEALPPAYLCLGTPRGGQRNRRLPPHPAIYGEASTL